jgi:hypothetical protein
VLQSELNPHTAIFAACPLKIPLSPALAGAFGMTTINDYVSPAKHVERQAMRIANNAGTEVTDSFVEFF